MKKLLMTSVVIGSFLVTGFAFASLSNVDKLAVKQLNIANGPIKSAASAWRNYYLQNGSEPAADTVLWVPSTASGGAGDVISSIVASTDGFVVTFQTAAADKAVSALISAQSVEFDAYNNENPRTKISADGGTFGEFACVYANAGSGDSTDLQATGENGHTNLFTHTVHDADALASLSMCKEASST